MTIEKLAEMTRDEFGSVRKETKEIGQLLNEKMDDGFATIRSEMQESTRAILAAIESVEYTKLRMRIDLLETRMGRMERSGER